LFKERKMVVIQKPQVAEEEISYDSTEKKDRFEMSENARKSIEKKFQGSVIKDYTDLRKSDDRFEMQKLFAKPRAAANKNWGGKNNWRKSDESEEPKKEKLILFETVSDTHIGITIKKFDDKLKDMIKNLPYTKWVPEDGIWLCPRNRKLELCETIG